MYGAQRLAAPSSASPTRIIDLFIRKSVGLCVAVKAQQRQLASQVPRMAPLAATKTLAGCYCCPPTDLIASNNIQCSFSINHFGDTQ